METRILCSIRFIDADESIYNFKFGDFSIIKGQDYFAKEIFTKNLINQAGVISVNEFRNYPFFYFKTLSNPDSLPQLANESHNKLNSLLNFLWINNDCSVNVGNLYCFIPDTEYLFASSKLAYFSSANGYFTETKINEFDFKEAYKTLQHYEGLASITIEDPKPQITYFDRPKISDSAYHFTDYNKNSRIERAVSFLSMARTNSFLPLKISLCMSFLECLFTTDRQEVTHKVCERVALYLGGSYEEKQLNYNSIKAAYDIRSGFFHGQEIDKKRDSRIQLEEHSKKVDDILRKILKLVLFVDSEVFNGPNEKRKDFFNKMVLG